MGLGILEFGFGIVKWMIEFIQLCLAYRMDFLFFEFVHGFRVIIAIFIVIN